MFNVYLSISEHSKKKKRIYLMCCMLKYMLLTFHKYNVVAAVVDVLGREMAFILALCC